MNDIVSVTKEKIQRYLTELVGSYEVVNDFYRIRHQSTALHIRPFLWKEKHAMVHISALIVRDVETRPGMWERLANLNREYMFGKPCFYPDDKIITWEYYLLGDFIDKDEFVTAVTLIALTADELDDKIQKEIGGKRFVDQ